MKKARIIESKIVNDGVEIIWNDGFMVYFDPSNSTKFPKCINVTAQMHLAKEEIERRVIVSRTSAQTTLSGCSC